MARKRNRRPGAEDAGITGQQLPPDGTESLLSSEIRFWQELIESLDPGSCSRESLERMRQALALAEYRLNGLQQPDPRRDPFAQPPRSTATH